MLEVVFLLETSVGRLQIVIAADPIFLVLLEDCRGIGYRHRLRVLVCTQELVRLDLEDEGRLTMSAMILGSDLFDDPIDDVHGTAAITLLLLAHQLHDSMPARISLEGVRLLILDQIPEPALLVRAKISLLRCELIVVELRVGC